tara:strand:- start:154 stop:867 length:714 start_codon:yes stop_codon:yes gene_type:complete
MKKKKNIIINKKNQKLNQPEEVKEKTLPKLTDFNTIKNVRNLTIHLKQFPEDWSDIFNNIQFRYNEIRLGKSNENDKVLEDMLCFLMEKEKSKESAKEIRNITYELNHTTISNYIHNYVIENNNFPTIIGISDDTNLSRQTVYNHINNGLLQENRSLVNKRSEYMINTAIEKLFIIGIKDKNIKALSQFLNFSTKGTNSSNINNYIQINNIKISTEDFNNLPPETMIQIEEILSSRN